MHKKFEEVYLNSIVKKQEVKKPVSKKIIKESTKPVKKRKVIKESKRFSKKHLIKEDWDVEYEKYDGYMNDHEQTLISLIQANDPSKVSQAIIATCEKENTNKSRFYSWGQAMWTAQFHCLDKVNWWKENGFTVSPEEEKEIKWYNWISNKLIEHERMAEDWECQDWTEEILKKGGATEFLDYANKLNETDKAALEADRFDRATTYDTPMYDDEDDSLHESKKVNTKKKVIKESKKSSKKHLICEDLEDLWFGYWQGWVKEQIIQYLKEKYSYTDEMIQDMRNEGDLWDLASDAMDCLINDSCNKKDENSISVIRNYVDNEMGRIATNAANDPGASVEFAKPGVDEVLKVIDAVPADKLDKTCIYVRPQNQEMYPVDSYCRNGLRVAGMAKATFFDKFESNHEDNSDLLPKIKAEMSQHQGEKLYMELNPMYWIELVPKKVKYYPEKDLILFEIRARSED